MPDWEWWLMDNSTDPYSLECSQKCADEDSRVIRVLDSFTEAERREVNPMAVLLNRYYGKANGDIIMYMSDDDLFTPHAFELAVTWLDEHPDEGVCWFSLQLASVTAPGQAGPWPFTDGILASTARGKDTGLQVDNYVDGGQIAHRKSCLDVIEQPWFPEEAVRTVAAHCDGLFMTKLAEHWTFWPAGDHMTPAAVHRYTPLHSWHPAGEIHGLR